MTKSGKQKKKDKTLVVRLDSQTYQTIEEMVGHIKREKPQQAIVLGLGKKSGLIRHLIKQGINEFSPNASHDDSLERTIRLMMSQLKGEMTATVRSELTSLRMEFKVMKKRASEQQKDLSEGLCPKCGEILVGGACRACGWGWQ